MCQERGGVDAAGGGDARVDAALGGQLDSGALPSKYKRHVSRVARVSAGIGADVGATSCRSRGLLRPRPSLLCLHFLLSPLLLLNPNVLSYPL